MYLVTFHRWCAQWGKWNMSPKQLLNCPTWTQMLKVGVLRSTWPPLTVKHLNIRRLLPQVYLCRNVYSGTWEATRSWPWVKQNNKSYIRSYSVVERTCRRIECERSFWIIETVVWQKDSRFHFLAHSGVFIRWNLLSCHHVALVWMDLWWCNKSWSDKRRSQPKMVHWLLLDDFDPFSSQCSGSSRFGD